MQIFKKGEVIDFMRLRKATAAMSLTLVLISVVSLAVRGLSFGIDFTGGTLIEAAYSKPADLPVVRDELAKRGFEDAVVQHFGTSKDVLIRLAPRKGISSAELADKVMTALKAGDQQVEMRRQEFVGPQVGDELAEDGGLAMLYALFGILIYVSLRFQYRFALGAVLALVHDTTITLGVFSLLQLEFNLTVLAAVLAVIGYSLNDTIVVFDRIRENFRKMRRGTTAEIINTSLTDTLSRTVMTSFTTLLVLISLFFFGGDLIHGFATALIIGIVVGTYSSIYIASSLLVAMKVTKEDLMPVKKEGEDLDRMP
mgnify:CR=1 FL=1